MNLTMARAGWLGICWCAAGWLWGADPVPRRPEISRLTTKELAQWIDDQFDVVWKDGGIEPPPLADDYSFAKRLFLDLNGVIPPVSQVREFRSDRDEYKRDHLVDRLLHDGRRPERYSERTATHWATLWRRMMVPGNTQEAQRAVALEPWLREQFAANVPYDEVARKLVTATTSAPVAPTPQMANASIGPAVFYQAIGGTPAAAASSVSRVFLGVRLGCAECHDHPFANWKQKDFWGMAAFFSGVRNGVVADAAAKIKPNDSEVEYVAVYLGSEAAQISADRSPRQLLVDWMVTRDNPHFAATAVNRVWMYLLGRGLTESVDDLDQASPAERRILDQLAQHFVDSGYDLRWLIAGICKSQVYQRESVSDQAHGVLPAGLRVVKTLTPEQVFNSLEQALLLPVARVDGSARFNGLRDQLISRMNEAASSDPEEFRAGIPQALLLMNGRLTAEATHLDHSRTLRGVLDAPFLDTEQKLTTLYLATLSRPPRAEEQQYLLEHVRTQATPEQRHHAFAEIFWALLNSPEFVLER